MTTYRLRMFLGISTILISFQTAVSLMGENSIFSKFHVILGPVDPIKILNNFKGDDIFQLIILYSWLIFFVTGNVDLG